MSRMLATHLSGLAPFTSSARLQERLDGQHPGASEGQAGSSTAADHLRRHFTTGDGVRIAYHVDGAADKPVLVLSNSIATDLGMWDRQVPELAEHFHVVRYDMRGHGESEVPAGAYSLDRLGRDVLELLDGLGIERAHFLGLSLGGFVGQWLGIHAPERIGRLILSNTASYLGPAAQWDEAINSVFKAEGMQETAERFLRNWFPTRLLEEGSAVVEPFRTTLLAMDRQGLAGSYAVVRDTDMRRTIVLITSPTLVIAGEHDPVTTVSHSETMAETIPGARLLVMPAAHMTHIEFPSEFMEVVLNFLRS
ncbi:alpha/beta fold hydrolase [Billgrantia saliphila]|uniref:alpha/beta fold hydrolase n=1 Tax=Billgrantia saliphila TaxID=1848458 RepID=UPI0018CC5D81|nr:alpha/beta fold hydrolase [Halomonas saliphila]